MNVKAYGSNFLLLMLSGISKKKKKRLKYFKMEITREQRVTWVLFLIAFHLYWERQVEMGKIT